VGWTELKTTPHLNKLAYEFNAAGNPSDPAKRILTGQRKARRNNRLSVWILRINFRIFLSYIIIYLSNTRNTWLIIVHHTRKILPIKTH